MMRNKIRALSLGAALVLCGITLAGFAQGVGAQGAQATASQSQKTIKTHFLVVRMMAQSLQVSSVNNVRDLHTFTYSPKIHDKMQTLFNSGGYQYGDKVAVWYRQGTDVALKIRGKPSKKK
jgi:hypothetical protein